MSNTNRTTVLRGGEAIGFTAVVVGLLYATFAVAASTGTATDCQDAWDDAPAAAYCTDTGVEAHTVDTTGGDSGKRETYCRISVSSCSITVNVGMGAGLQSVTYRPSWDNYYQTQGVPLRVTRHFDICFEAATGSSASIKEGWRAFVLGDVCPTAATASATAVSNGLQ